MKTHAQIKAALKREIDDLENWLDSHPDSIAVSEELKERRDELRATEFVNGGTG